jgi:hypothetical protein
MVEELAGVPYHLQRRRARARVRCDDGTWESILTYLHLWHWERNFPKVEPILEAAGAQRTGTVGAAAARVIQARALGDLLVPLLQDDPLFLLADTARAGYVRRAQRRSTPNETGAFYDSTRLA